MTDDKQPAAQTTGSFCVLGEALRVHATPGRAPSLLVVASALTVGIASFAGLFLLA